MSKGQPPNIDEIKRQSVVRFLAEMQDLKQKIELDFSSRFDTQKNNFLSTSKSSYAPREIGSIFDTIKSIELENIRAILTNTSGNGSKILSNTLSSALSGNLTFSGEATQRIAELEQENNRLKAEIVEKEKVFEKEKVRSRERGEDQIGEMNRLQEQADEQKRTIELYEKQVMELGETLTQQRVEIEDLQGQVGALSQDKERTENLLQEKEDLLIEQEKNLQSQKEQMASMEKRIQQMKAVTTEKFEAETKRLEDTLNMERERADDLEVRVKEATTAITNYKAAVQQKDDEITKLRKSLTDIKAQTASGESEKDAKIKKLEDLQKSLQNQYVDTKNSLDRSEKKIESITKEIDKKDKLIDNKDIEIRELKTQLADLQENITGEKVSQEGKLQNLIKEKTKSETDMNILKKEIRDLKTTLDEKVKTISEVTKAQQVIEKDRDAIQEERDSYLMQLGNMKTRIEELEKSTEQKDGLVKNLTKSLQGVPKFRVFLAIQDIGGSITLTDLAKIAGQSLDVVQDIVTDLKEDGLVKVTKKENKTFVAKV